MRIAHFCESLLRGGGISSFISNLVGEQAKTQSITLAVINAESADNRVPISSDVEVKEFGKNRLGFSVKYPILVYRYIRISRFDVVHIHSSFLYYALSVILLHRQIKFVYTIHSDAVKENASKWDKRFFWLKKLCVRIGWIHPITISQASKMSFDELYGVDSKLIVNGIRKPIYALAQGKLVKYRYSTQTKVFYHPGRITEAKNQVMLCEAFSRLIAKNADVVLIISGTKQDISIYNQLERFFSDRIVYLGERNDVLDLLSEADAMCLPSKWEGLPIVLLEALSVGCIPICTSVGGIPEVVADGENGLLAENVRLDDYIEALYRFISMSDVEISQMKDNALLSFDKFSIEGTSREYCDYYHYILSKQSV